MSHRSIKAPYSFIIYRSSMVLYIKILIAVGLPSPLLTVAVVLVTTPGSRINACIVAPPCDLFVGCR